jgi:AcrR family transcriptional regulator
MARSEPETRPSEARLRLLTTAARLFYAEGIHAVGVDRIIVEAAVTRATLYRHFAGKEALVQAYLQGADRMIRQQVDAAVAGHPAAGDAVRAVAATIAATIRSPGFRGCAFLNAVAEYPDPDNAVHRSVLAHRHWFSETMTTLLARVHEAEADLVAQHFVMLRDGAMSAGCLFDPDLIGATFLRGVDGLVRTHAVRRSG